MATKVHGIRVFDPRVGTRDGLEFTATFNNHERRCFISGTALGKLRGDIVGDSEAVFNEHWSVIAVAVSRKDSSSPDGEIVITSDDIRALD